jgi:thiamine kinase-like enzyme
LLDNVTTGHLVHSDYQFENLLHRDGVITGIIDFEWAVSGDPARDFRLDEQWDDDCPGSRAYIYEGYQQLRALEPDHEARVLMYKLQFHMDTVDMYAGDPAEADRFALYYQKMMDVLVALENLFKI